MSGWFLCDDVSSINDHCLDLLIHGQVAYKNADVQLLLNFR